jgi:4-carboxymuconolactone decarboxylase
MSRIPPIPVDRAPAETRDFLQRRGALNVFRLLATAPRVFGGWTKMTDELLNSPTFGLRQRELVTLRVAHIQQCPYELAQHIDIARRGQSGITAEQIAALTGDGPLEHAHFDEAELTVLNFVTELCTSHWVNDESFGRVHALLGTDGVTELLMLVSLYYGLALVLNATELDIDDHVRLHV